MESLEHRVLKLEMMLERLERIVLKMEGYKIQMTASDRLKCLTSARTALVTLMRSQGTIEQARLLERIDEEMLEIVEKTLPSQDPPG